MIAEFPQKLMDIAKLPPRYKNFLQIRINILFLTVKLTVTKIMIAKNNIILSLLNPTRGGIYSDKVVGYFEMAKNLITMANQLYIEADSIYQAVIQILSSPMFTIPPESYVWLITPRALAHYPGMLYVEVPTHVTVNPLYGPMSATDIEKVTKIVQSWFPPILAPEYLMSPSAFRYRLAMSPQSPIVQKTAELLASYLKSGPEYMPAYKDLTLANVFFVWAILVGWAPKAK